MHLHHLHLKQSTPYRLASSIQELLARGKINHSLGKSGPDAVLPRDASPSLLTYVAQPTYTSGRRQHMSASQIQTLEHGPSLTSKDATYVHSPRGGLLTFHGPGQLTAYPLVHLRSHGLTPRCYVRALETSIIAALARFGVTGFTRNEYPGVWVAPDKKLASIGVHVQRGVTCFGTGINVATDPDWWRRFTACGIEGVQMVNLRDCGADGVSTEQVGAVLAECLAEELVGVDAVESASEEERRELCVRAKERMES